MADPAQDKKVTIRWAIFLAATTIVFFGIAVGLISSPLLTDKPTFEVKWVSGEEELNSKEMPIEFWHDKANNLLIHRGKIDQDQRNKLLNLSSDIKDKPKREAYRQSIYELASKSNAPQASLGFLLVVTSLGGIIGVQARSISYFILHACVKNDLNLKRWWAWYCLRPLLGMIFGPLVVLLIMTGVLPATKDVPQTGTLTMFVLSILVGVVATMFFDKLVRLAQTLLGLNSDDAPPQPPSLPPAPINAIGKWDPLASQAVITWTDANERTQVDHYEVRMTPAAAYDPQNLKVAGTNIPPGTSEFRVAAAAAGLGAPGNVASFKVYVILTNKNESGSNTVAITRP